MAGDPYPGKIKYEGGKPVKLTMEEIVASVALGGWPENLWPTAAAVADAESVGGAINVYNTYKEGHYGLFQISKSSHPGFFSSGKSWVSPIENSKEAYRIYQDAGNSFKPWEAYTNGRYAPGLLSATAAVGAVKVKRSTSQKKGADFYLSLYRANLREAFIFLGLPPLGEAVAGAIGDAAEATGNASMQTAESVAEGLARVQSSGIFGVAQVIVGASRALTDPSWWIRAAQVVVGSGLLMIGLAAMAKPSGGRAAEAAAKVAAPAAKAAQVAAKAMDKTKSGGAGGAPAKKTAAPAKKSAAAPARKSAAAAAKGGKK
jgi:hypothetical protein